MDAQLVTYFIENGRPWVVAQRELHRPNGRTLTTQESAALLPYFNAATLNSVVIREVPLIENPGFYAELAARDTRPPLDFSQMHGITFVDTIVVTRQRMDSNNTPWLSLLFHECVHVCQYRALGVASFVKYYVEGWAQHGFNYFAIPLEVQAYQLQHSYDSTMQPFPAEQIVNQSLGRKA